MKLIAAPLAEKIPFELSKHGETRIDNYYWMRLSDEQKNAETPDEHCQKVLDYLNAENDFTKTTLSHTEAFQEKLYQEIVGRIQQDDETVPYFKNGYWYYTRFEKGKEYPIYCRKEKSLDGIEQVLLDVNLLAEGQSYCQVGALAVSPNNKILAYALDTVGRRIYKIQFVNIESGEKLSDEIIGTTGSIAWANDNATLFYTLRNEQTLLSEKVLRHRVGTNSSEDVLVYQEMDSSYYIGVYRSKSGKYILIWNSSTLSTDYWLLETDNPEGKFWNFCPREPEHEYEIEHFEDRFYIKTNWNAQNNRLMECSLGQTDKSNWKEIIAHRPQVFLEGVEVFKNHLVIAERTDGLMMFRIRNQTTQQEHYMQFEEPAYMAGISTNPEFDSQLLRYSYSSMTTPNSIYDYDLEGKTKELKKRTEVVGGHNPEEYVTERQWAPAHDGKDIPISIVYKKGTKLDGSAPLLLYGYGSYGHTIDAYFSSVRLSLLDRGFVFAIAHIRGGQMLGRPWYDDGKMLNKKNTFKDFISCAQFLAAEDYTATDRLFAMGGSAGGLLMGAIVNMAPKLFKGIVSVVPFVDVLTTMSDPTIPLTTNEYGEWGNPDNKEEYDYIKSYSPYENITRQDYPNILVVTGLFDSQVQYWEPAKWVAKLREFKTDQNLLLLHTNMSAGHSGASGRFEQYKDTALEYAFILDLAGITE